MTMTNRASAAWLRDARFGLFIHWGLYALPHPPHWRPREIEQQGEWIMQTARVPLAEYRQLARRFRAPRFDADEWVRTAREAGMRYLVFTAKHHDGFAMFKSFHPYNVVDATPFARDPAHELAEACRRYGIRFCLYYSHALDWEAPGAPRHAEPVAPAAFERYLREKSFPQVRELLSNYGPIGLMWFDMPYGYTREQSWELRGLVKSLQPDCLINSRIWHGAHDYGALGDNMTPSQASRELRECPATMNNTWGFLPHDRNWKSADALIRQLSTLASKNTNYLLNVGPRGDGAFPAASVARLRRMGAWLRDNGEAIYGTDGGPFAGDPPWGVMTAKPGKLYLHFHSRPEDDVIIRGLRADVVKACMLPRADREIPFQIRAKGDVRDLTLRLPKQQPPAGAVSVVALDMEGEPKADPRLLQQPDGQIALVAAQAVRQARPGVSPPRISSQLGTVEGWTLLDQWLEWTFTLLEPGPFELAAVTTMPDHVVNCPAWIGGHVLKAEVAGHTVCSELRADVPGGSLRAQYHAEALSRLGTLTLDRAGAHRLVLRVERINPAARQGVTLDHLLLRPLAGGALRARAAEQCMGEAVN
jgi:alpha-L-fucosidase